MKTAGTFVLLALVVATAAVALPHFAFPHDRAGLDDATVRYTVGQARLMSSVPPLRLQVTEVRKPPTRPQGVADATLTWRTIFGVPYGMTTIDGDATTSDWHIRTGVLAWAGFIVVEVLLLGAAARIAWTSP